MLGLAYATGRASHATQVKGDGPDTKGYSGCQVWVFGVGLTTPPSKKICCYESRAKKKLDRLNNDGRKKTRYTEITLATWNVQTMVRNWKEIFKCWE